MKKIKMKAADFGLMENDKNKDYYSWANHTMTTWTHVSEPEQTNSILHDNETYYTTTINAAADTTYYYTPAMPMNNVNLTVDWGTGTNTFVNTTDAPAENEQENEDE